MIISMKTERISLFILAIEILAITYLHSAKNNPQAADKELARFKSAKIVPIHPHLSFIEFR